MNIKKYFGNRTLPFRVHHAEENAVQTMHEQLIKSLPVRPREYVAVCIGTDRSTGDALGPLTGSYLSEIKPRHLTVYGTLHEPIHAVNLKESIEKIQTRHRNPFIIAVDACLGRRTSIGQIILDRGPLKPGAAFNKELPPIGDLQLIGVVNMSGFMDHAALQNTRLSLVTDMAKTLAHLLDHLDQQLTYQYSLPLATVKGKKSI